MDHTLVILQILGVLLLGAASPGPSFVIVSRSAAAASRRVGLLVAMGMGIGGSLFAVLALLGIGTLMHSLPWLFLAVSGLGGVYLLYLAAKLLIQARQPLSDTAGQDVVQTLYRAPFLRGVAVQISNPKTIVVYASVFASLLPASVDTRLFFVLPPLVFMLEAGWYSVVVLLFSSAAMRRQYLTWKAALDLTAGLVIGLLALRTLVEAVGQVRLG